MRFVYIFISPYLEGFCTHFMTIFGHLFVKYTYAVRIRLFLSLFLHFKPFLQTG